MSPDQREGKGKSNMFSEEELKRIKDKLTDVNQAYNSLQVEIMQKNEQLEILGCQYDRLKAIKKNMMAVNDAEKEGNIAIRDKLKIDDFVDARRNK